MGRFHRHDDATEHSHDDHAHPAGQSHVHPAADIAGSRFEAYDSLAKVYGLYTTLTKNPNLAEYQVPVNADIPNIEAILVEERDVHVNALGIKGVGEIGITGTAGAIANAVWHATGVRVRRFPITLDQLIGA